MMHRATMVAITLMTIAVCAVTATAGSSWTPEKWEDGSTLRFQTTDVDRQEHWSTVWYVVLQGEVYVRLGTTAADLIDNNIKRPYVKVKIGTEQFDDVRADPALGMAATVGDTMADKYPMDFLFRYLPHPMTVRLRAASF